MKLSVKHYFDAAHQLKDSPDLVTKECARLHGHTYKVIVDVTGKLNNAGMVVDFKAVKQIIDRFDHRYVNDVLSEYDIQVQPTAESIAEVIHGWLENELNLDVSSVAVCEGYKGEEKASYAIYGRDNV